MLLSLSESTVNHSFLRPQPTENLRCHLGALPKGMSIHRGDCVWIVVSEAMLPTETIKSTVTASGQNKGPFFSHNSATFWLSKSQKTRTADKGNSAGCGRWSSGKADLVCQLNLQHTWTRKLGSNSASHGGPGLLSQVFCFSLKSSTHARVDANRYLRHEKKKGKGMGEEEEEEGGVKCI